MTEWVLLVLMVGTTLSSAAKVTDKPFPLDMENCTQVCQCWFRNGTSMDQLSPANCLNFCADDHTKPCFDWTKCRVIKDTICQLSCGSLRFNCIPMDHPLNSQETTFFEWISYVMYAIVAVLCVAVIIIVTVKKSKFR